MEENKREKFLQQMENEGKGYWGVFNFWKIMPYGFVLLGILTIPMVVLNNSDLYALFHLKIETQEAMFPLSMRDAILVIIVTEIWCVFGYIVSSMYYDVSQLRVFSIKNIRKVRIIHLCSALATIPALFFTTFSLNLMTTTVALSLFIFTKMVVEALTKGIRLKDEQDLIV